MKSVAVIVFAGLLAPAFAQDAPPPKIDPPPPPAMNSPGVRASELAPQSTASTAAAAAASAAKARDDNPMTRRPPPLPQVGGLPPGPSPATTPQVTVRKQDGNTIEEYREGGRVYMVVVTPPNGIRQTYMLDQDGKLRGGASDAPVSPVMYTILEWGKSKPAADQDDDTPAPAASAAH